jgi:phosphatidylserine/phosphatidylglycerophosphate/cardiolipin synthase-like enzyme
LVKAHERGVEVKVVFEAEHAANYPISRRLKDAGIEVRNDTNPSFMHNKVAIIENIGEHGLSYED